MRAPGLVVDTSAAVAILTDEPDAEWLVDALVQSERRCMAAGTYLELGIVMETKLGPTATGMASRFVRDAEIEIVPVEGTGAERALEGWRLFGKGRHPAGLNFGDCFTYGLASDLNLPILCIGNDFSRTDLFVLQPPSQGDQTGA